MAVGARKDDMNSSLGVFEAGSSSGLGRKQKDGKNDSRTLDPAKHTMVVIKENRNPNLVNDINPKNNLGFKNLVSPSSLSTFLKEKTVKGIMEN